MKKMIALVTVGLVMLLTFLNLSSACWLYWYQPELPQPVRPSQS